MSLAWPKIRCPSWVSYGNTISPPGREMSSQLHFAWKMRGSCSGVLQATYADRRAGYASGTDFVRSGPGLQPGPHGGARGACNFTFFKIKRQGPGAVQWFCLPGITAAHPDPFDIAGFVCLGDQEFVHFVVPSHTSGKYRQARRAVNRFCTCGIADGFKSLTFFFCKFMLARFHRLLLLQSGDTKPNQTCHSSVTKTSQDHQWSGRNRRGAIRREYVRIMDQDRDVFLRIRRRLHGSGTLLRRACDFDRRGRLRGPQC